MVPLLGRVTAPVADAADNMRMPADRAVDKFGMCDDTVAMLAEAVVTPVAAMPLTIGGAGMLRRDTIGVNDAAAGVGNVIADADEVTFDTLLGADATGYDNCSGRY